MKYLIFGAICFSGGYAASVFTWTNVHTWFIGVQAKADKLREKARELEASIRARL